MNRFELSQPKRNLLCLNFCCLLESVSDGSDHDQDDVYINKGWSIAYWLGCWTVNREGVGFKSSLRQKDGVENSAPPELLTVNSGMMSTLIGGKVGRRGRGLTTRRNEKMRSLSFHAHGCLRAKLWDWFSPLLHIPAKWLLWRVILKPRDISRAEQNLVRPLGLNFKVSKQCKKTVSFI